MSASQKKLFEDFPPSSAEAWITQTIRDLKGRDFEETLVYSSADGIKIRPFYTREDVPDHSSRSPLFNHTDWEICEHLDGTDAAEINQKALRALDTGATALILEVPEGAAPEVLLQDIGLPYIQLHLQLSGNTTAFEQQLDRFLTQAGHDRSALRLSLGADIIGELVRSGSWHQSPDEDLQRWIGLQKQFTPFRTCCVEGAIYQEAGAAPAYELACILAHVHAYIRLLIGSGASPALLKDRLRIHMAAGPDYFFEIAKMRALRKLLPLVLESYGINSPPYLHVTTAFWNMTAADVHNNLLRTSTAAMAAATGGCNSLTVRPFNSVIKKEDPFAERMARNIQLILKAESFMDRMADPAAGSYFIETLTDELGSAAWDHFRAIESGGGLLAALERGSIQAHIRESGAKRTADFEAGKYLLVGVNKFRNEAESVSPALPLTKHRAENGRNDIEPILPVRIAEKMKL